MLHIYNSLTRKKEPLAPIEPGKVRMYVCGMTVYDYCHLGHARVLVVFDVVARYLRTLGYEVTYARNITDIDDKIIQRARDNGEEITALTARFIEAMHEDAQALKVLPSDLEPRATLSMDQIIAMIRALLDKGFAYQSDNGDVYYDVSRFNAYGRLSGKRLEDLRSGARVEIGEGKDDPLDFVLWKAAKEGEPSWQAPWGSGRPGWHIECSAMSTHCLGGHFDIHGGGMDLMFPHHENEIAQSEAATGHKFVNIWMHNGFVQIDEEKMSKSLGNFFTVREVLQRYPPEAVRYFILGSHYRSPLNYSDKNLDGAKAALTALYTALRGIDASMPEEERRGLFSWSDHKARFFEAMNDDFNTPEALAVLFDLAHHLNRLREKGDPQTNRMGALLRYLGGILGILENEPQVFLQGENTADAGLKPEEIERLVALRDNARRAENWPESDRIRAYLRTQGVILEDGPSGSTWRRE